MSTAVPRNGATGCGAASAVALTLAGVILYERTVFVMLVKALRLRYLGHRIPVDVLSHERPMTGELSYHPHLHRQSMTCMLMPLGGDTEPLAQLFACKIKIVQRGILIRGEEDVWKRKRRDSYPQTIWAWAYSLAPATESIVVTAPPAVDILREATR